MLTTEQLLWMFEKMTLSRLYEEAIQAAYFEGKLPHFNLAKGPIPGEMHLSNGQEPCAAGVCVWLEKRDVVTAGHRPHHIAIAKGVNLRAMTAEIFGKATGLGGGRGGHMHLFDPSVGFSCSGIVGEGLAPAVGAAFAQSYDKTGAVAVAFTGDGAANQGVFHEALNLAAIWRAPVVFVIEDNSYGISVSKTAVTSVPDNSVRAVAYGMPGVRVKDNDPIAIATAAKTAIDRARAGDGPSLIEIETFRLAGHFVGDQQQYRPEGEHQNLVERDALPKFRAYLETRGDISDRMLADVELHAREMVIDAIAYARASTAPAPSDAFEKVFA